jgi:hypothetical protein
MLLRHELSVPTTCGGARYRRQDQRCIRVDYVGKSSDTNLGKVKIELLLAVVG